MIDLPPLVNLVAYCAQLLCVVAAGAAAEALLGLERPAVRYAFWRGMLLLCLALPWLQGR